MKKNKLRILITNDDGANCPLFYSLVDSIAKTDFCEDILIVVPAFEQSWISNAITRDKEILHTKEVYGSYEYNIIDGTPADCTAIGLCHLAQKKWTQEKWAQENHADINLTNKNVVDLVISGINMGTNAGDAFTQSSGTIAAVKTGSLFGIPGIACSATLPPEMRKAWTNRDFDYLKQTESTIAEITNYHVRSISSLINSKILEIDTVDYVSINTPVQINQDIAPVICKTKQNLFKEMFTEIRENIYSHKFSGFIDKPDRDSTGRDLDLLAKGLATISCFSSSLSEDFTLQTSDIESLQEKISNNFKS